jgi:hypothetical protein
MEDNLSSGKNTKITGRLNYGKDNSQNYIPDQMDNDVREEQVCLSLGTHRTTFAIKGSYQEKSENGFLATASRIRLNQYFV